MGSGDGDLSDKGSPATLPGCIQFDFPSHVTGRTYRIFVAKPPVAPPPTGYPVFLAVDGNLVFPIAVAVNASFAMAGRAALVVGVGYASEDPLDIMQRRTRDLTPPTPPERVTQRLPGLPSPKLEDFGGAGQFFHFLTDELLPYIAKVHSIDESDTSLYGHSVGGLFTIGVLFNYPNAFKNFIASSPSIFWNRRSVLNDFKLLKAQLQSGQAGPRVLLMVGGAEQSVPKPIPDIILGQVAERVPQIPKGLQGAVAWWFVRKMLREYAMVSNLRALASRLRQVRGPKKYLVRDHIFADEDHTTALPASIGRAFDFILRT
jgi:predicted alpha/beta superfamily hydrolase